MRITLWKQAAASVVLGLSAHPALAQSVEDFYRGKTVSLVVSSSTGGGYDTLARMISRYLPKHLPASA